MLFSSSGEVLYKLVMASMFNCMQPLGHLPLGKSMVN